VRVSGSCYVYITNERETMKNHNFEICFVCRYPTTDFEVRYGGEYWCGSCVQEENIVIEHEAVYYALAEHWEEDMKSMLADH